MLLTQIALAGASDSEGFRMNTRLIRGAGALMAACLLTCGVHASAKPILMPTLQKEAKQQRAYWQQHTLAPLGPIQPPAPPCPENGLLPSPLTRITLPNGMPPHRSLAR